MKSKSMIVDSAMSTEEILAQNPVNPAPPKILSSQTIISVVYYDFDGEIHKGQLVVNQQVAKEVASFFDLAIDIKFPIAKVVPISNDRYHWDDEISCQDNNTSGYNYRLIAGTSKVSKHASGLAFDVNPVQNIYIKFDSEQKEIFRFPPQSIYNKDAPGTLTPHHPLVKHMKKLGWDWGGDWKPESERTDYQHFEK